MAAPMRSPSSTSKPGLRARRPEDVFSREGPLGARADVRVVTSDGHELWLHRIVLEMWSELFKDLVAAAEESLDPDGSVATIVLTDTASDIMLLLSCLYPASHHPDRPQGSTLDAPSCLPLLALADKYHCPHIIHRCAGFTLEHVLPRLAAATSADEASDYLRPTSSSFSSFVAASASASSSASSSAAAVLAAVTAADWVVRCLELAARLELAELAEAAARLLGQRFFDWGLQDQAHRDLLARAARVLPAEQFVDLFLGSIPQPAATSGPSASAGARSPGRPAASPARGGGNGAAGAGPGAAGGGGPRIVPVVVAAAGPAAAVVPPAAPPAAPPLLAPQAPQVPPPQQQQQQQQAGAPQPFQEQFPAHQQQHQQLNVQHPLWQPPAPFWHQAGAQGGAHAQPEPLLGPGHAGW